MFDRTIPGRSGSNLYNNVAHPCSRCEKNRSREGRRAVGKRRGLSGGSAGLLMISIICQYSDCFWPIREDGSRCVSSESLPPPKCPPNTTQSKTRGLELAALRDQVLVEVYCFCVSLVFDVGLSLVST